MPTPGTPSHHTPLGQKSAIKPIRLGWPVPPRLNGPRSAAGRPRAPTRPQKAKNARGLGLVVAPRRTPSPRAKETARSSLRGFRNILGPSPVSATRRAFANIPRTLRIFGRFPIFGASLAGLPVGVAQVGHEEGACSPKSSFVNRGFRARVPEIKIRGTFKSRARRPFCLGRRFGRAVSRPKLKYPRGPPRRRLVFFSTLLLARNAFPPRKKRQKKKSPVSRRRKWPFRLPFARTPARPRVPLEKPCPRRVAGRKFLVSFPPFRDEDPPGMALPQKPCRNKLFPASAWSRKRGASPPHKSPGPCVRETRPRPPRGRGPLRCGGVALFFFFFFGPLDPPLIESGPPPSPASRPFGPNRKPAGVAPFFPRNWHSGRHPVPRSAGRGMRGHPPGFFFTPPIFPNGWGPYGPAGPPPGLFPWRPRSKRFLFFFCSKKSDAAGPWKNLPP